MKVCEMNYSCSSEIIELETEGECQTEWSIPAEYYEVHDRIFAKLINTEKNADLLEKIPNEPVLDLSLVFYLFRDNDPDGEEILVTEEMLDNWKVDYFQVFEDAMANTRSIMGESVRPLRDLIGEMLRDSKIDIDLCEEDEVMPMYVMTNLWRRNGAVCVLFKETVKELADMLDEDLYVIPSSVHEVIIVPAEKGVCRKDLDQMIREINKSELDSRDVLSDHAYYFSRGRGQIEM